MSAERGLDLFAEEVLTTLGTLTGVARVGIAINDGGDRGLLFTSDDRLDEAAESGEDLEWCRIDAVETVPLTRAALRGVGTFGSLDDVAVDFPDFAERQQQAGVVEIAVVPILDDRRPIGGLILYADRADVIAAIDRDWLEGIGRRVGGDLLGMRTAHRRPFEEPEDPASAHREVWTMPAEPEAVGPARRRLRQLLTLWGTDADVVDDALLCLTEVATNALVHTHGGCRIEVEQADAVLAVRVVDSGAPGPVRLSTTTDLRTHGRGLQIVAALAARSGRDAEALTTWFEFDLPS